MCNSLPGAVDMNAAKAAKVIGIRLFLPSERMLQLLNEHLPQAA